MHSPSQTNSPIARLSTVPLVLPMVRAHVSAGFASPAADYDIEPINLTDVLVLHLQATNLVRVTGHSMVGAGIDDGDYIVVDRAITPEHGHIVVAMIDGEVTVKYLHKQGGRFRLKAANPAYADIVPELGQVVEIWGVVTSCIKRFVKF